jgi:hypothetical protein
MATNVEILKELREFKKQYEIDMRGDKSLENGERGVIGNIRILKEEWRAHPSITKMASEHPGKALSVLALAFSGGIVAFGVLFALFSSPPVYAWITSVFSIPVP